MKKRHLIPLLCLAVGVTAVGGAHAAKRIDRIRKETSARIGVYKAGEGIAGSTLQVIDESGEVVDEWKSTGKEHVIYAKLIAGATYRLHEVRPPDGYLLEEDITFTVNPDGSVNEIVMADPPTTAEISKLDAKTKDFVYQAVLQVKDSRGYVLDEWESGGEPHRIRGALAAGETYTVHEVSAPPGYKKAEDMAFTMPDTEEPYAVAFYNVKDDADSPPTPTTGDKMKVFAFIGIGSAALVAMGVFTAARRRVKER